MSLRADPPNQTIFPSRIEACGANAPDVQALPASHSDSERRLWGLRPLRWALRIYEINPACGQHRSRDGSDVFNRMIDLRVPSDATPAERVPIIEQRVAEVSIELRELRDRSILDKNLRLLKKSIGLTDVEIDLLAFVILQRRHPEFSELVTSELSRMPEPAMLHRVADILGCSPQHIEEVLDPGSGLMRSGLVYMESFCHSMEVWGWFVPVSAFARRVLHDAKSAENLLRGILPPARQPTLTLVDYPHLAPELGFLSNYLEVAVRDKRIGVNVLLYGRPGTGKSELAAAIAAALGCQLYEVGGAQENEEASTSRMRLREAACAQRVIPLIGSGLVLIDEAEDFFPAPLSHSRNVPTKVAINEILERNPAPTIWICNRTRHMEEAFLRRFDFVLHVPPLPARLKRGLLRNGPLADALTNTQISNYAECRDLSPASLTRMIRVAVDASKGDPAKVQPNLSLLSTQYLRTLGVNGMVAEQDTASISYDLGLLNTDPSISRVLDTMAPSGFGGRLLLHGVPGTGKTALGKALATKLEMPLLRYQASSLLSCYVGETEHNLRGMFEHARRERGLLLLDEADSFLRARESARARWEVSQVNELLMQMEAFEGVFVCTTNRLDDLDPAALRRFDLKVEFRPLDQEQRLQLIRHCCKRLGIEVDTNALNFDAHIRLLVGLTPGDAAAALRRLRFLGGTQDLDTLLATLVNECRYKPAAHRPIGFLH